MTTVNISYITEQKPKELVELQIGEIFIDPTDSEPYIVTKLGRHFNLISLTSGTSLLDYEADFTSLAKLSESLEYYVDYLGSGKYESLIFASENVEINLVLTEEKSYDI